MLDKNKALDMAKNINVNQEQSKKIVKDSLDRIKNNSLFQDFSNTWNNFSEKEKEQIYKDGDYAFTMTWSIKRNMKIMNPISSPFRSPLVRLFQKESFKEQLTKDSFETMSAGIRFMIHLWLLKKPDNIANEDLMENIKKDAKNIKNKLWILEKAAMVIPQLRPALPVIQNIKPILESSADLWQEIMSEEQNKLSTNQEADKINKETKQHNKTYTKQLAQQRNAQNQEAEELKWMLNEWNDIEKEQAKQEIQNIFSESSLKNMKLEDQKDIEEIQKTTEKYGKIMDNFGIDTVLGWLPGGDTVSWAFSAMFFIHQAGKLPKWKELPWYDKAKIFWLQLVDSFGKPLWKAGAATALGFWWATLWTWAVPVLWTIVWWAVWAAAWYAIWWTLFDHFFKANKRSAKVFNNHCKKILEEAKNQWIDQFNYKKMETEQSKLASWFGGNKVKQAA